MAHKPRDKSPKNVQNYIKWRETIHLVKPKKLGIEPRTADKSLAARKT